MKWFWAHRRNTSLNHMSIFVRGLHGKGFLPVVDFYFKNQIYVGKPQKGVYIFYDKDELNRKYKGVQKSIDENSNFAAYFKGISDKLFNELFAVCKVIKETNLESLGKKELLDLLIKFNDKITVGPIITVQLWGIEACWDEDYMLAKELRSKLSNDLAEFYRVKGDLSQSTGKSVAFSEREAFLKALIRIQEVMKKKKTVTSKALNDHPEITSI